MQPTVLIVDDDRNILRLWQDIVERLGFQVAAASSGAEAEAHLARQIPDVALLDLRLPDTDGLALLEKIKALSPDVPVILVSAQGTIGEAVQAMKLGAYDFLVKPNDANQRLDIAITNAMELKRLRSDMRALQSLVGARREFRGILGQSTRMQRIYSLIENIAPSSATVLITGESGAGKELVARAIHDCSPRALNPFIAINCAAIPESLLESQLFGHERGAFTGAERQMRGKFELAHTGSLFLDEIGEMPPELQSKLLRVLQDRAFYRVGGEKLVNVDARIIAATNRNIDALVKEGRFREDLFYRLDVVRVELPPLRERQGDIPQIATHFLKLYSDKYGKLFKAFDTAVMDILRAAPWRGNVRELQNIIERIVTLHNGDVVSPEMIPATLAEAARDHALTARAQHEVTPAPAAVPPVPPESALAAIIPMIDLEKRAVAQALQATRGNAVEAARLLKISTATIYRKIRRFKLQSG